MSSHVLTEDGSYQKSVVKARLPEEQTGVGAQEGKPCQLLGTDRRGCTHRPFEVSVPEALEVPINNGSETLGFILVDFLFLLQERILDNGVFLLGVVPGDVAVHSTKHFLSLLVLVTDGVVG